MFFEIRCFILAGVVDYPVPSEINSPRFQIRVCTRETCGLRFSAVLGDPKANRCPACRAVTRPVEPLFERAVVGQAAGRPAGPELEVLLDNIRSAWNVGSMLRTADGAGVRRVHLCGVSAPPENPKVAKTSLGAERSIPCAFHPDGLAAARALKEQGLRIWALEGGARAGSLFEAAADLRGAAPHPPLALVVGNELCGVDPGILDLCERVVCLPMQGVKGSLNVAVAFGIAVYTIRFGV